MTLLQRVFNSFHRLVSKLNNDDETEATICDDLDPYMVSVVKRLNEQATDNVVPMARARISSRVA